MSQQVEWRGPRKIFRKPNRYVSLQKIGVTKVNLPKATDPNLPRHAWPKWQQPYYRAPIRCRTTVVLKPVPKRALPRTRPASVLSFSKAVQPHRPANLTSHTSRPVPAAHARATLAAREAPRTNLPLRSPSPSPSRISKGHKKTNLELQDAPPPAKKRRFVLGRDIPGLHRLPRIKTQPTKEQERAYYSRYTFYPDSSTDHRKFNRYFKKTRPIT